MREQHGIASFARRHPTTRSRQRVLEHHHPAERPVVVVGRPRAVPDRHVRHDLLGQRHRAVDREPIDEGLERRAGLAAHLHEVPVLILCCVEHDGSPSDISRGASIYPAVQNMLLAARGLGLASVLTTRPRRGFEKAIKEKLGIPEHVDTDALLPLGSPAAGSRYGPTNRRPVEEVTFDEKWGQRWEART
jgi:nitroreductase